ncbi:glycoside hydrolase, partial [bacterium]|nr:glycoside hydrolase [bacterium]
IHRRAGDVDFYFVRNQTDEPIKQTVSFRVGSERAEFWDPVTAEQFSISSATRTDDKTSIKLELPAYGSAFIVFSNETRVLPEYNQTAELVSTSLEGPWTLSFPEGWGAPPSVELDELISWTEHQNEGIKYFSGTATYRNSFAVSKAELESSSVIDLDLGAVRDVAEVLINGTSAGVLWTAPFKLNIQDFLSEGENQVEIKITNMWVNRLTGDIDLPDDAKFTRTNRPPMLRPRTELGDETYRIQPSGLLGPVSVIRKVK